MDLNRGISKSDINFVAFEAYYLDDARNYKIDRGVNVSVNTDLGADFISCSANDAQEMSEQCTESCIPQYPYTKDGAINLQ